jgi:2-polyprenyl-3-methyl-5-hydroxy-6-metoxy-1,4-benzoquinol methylase
MDFQHHWENVYQTKKATEVSWFEAELRTSLTLIESIAPSGGRIIDIGGGASLLVDRLVATGKWEVTVLDISATALKLAQTRLQENARRVGWIQADVTESQQLGIYDVWHDRAVFHFLTTPEARERYLARLQTSLRPGGYAIFGTFALQGPEKCSGLPVCRYSAETLAKTLGKGYTLIQELEHAHATPNDKTQLFTFTVFRKSV